MCGVQSLLKSYEHVQSEIQSYSSEVDRLNELSRKVIEGSTTSTPHYVCQLQYTELKPFLNNTVHDTFLQTGSDCFQQERSISPVEEDTLEEEEVEVCNMLSLWQVCTSLA